MSRPKSSAIITSAALQKVGRLKAVAIGVEEAWQRDAFSYFEIIGEVAKVMNLTANTLARCDMRPVENNNEVAPGGWKETDDERVLRVWDAFMGERGGQKELLRKASLHLQIAGESYLLGSPLGHGLSDSGIVWEFCSPEEIKVEGSSGRGAIKRMYGGYAGQTSEELSEDVYIARLWRSDPRFADRPDCLLKHVLPICREVVTLTQVIDAIAKSRLPAGILFVADELSFGPIEETEDDSDETSDIDPLTEEIIEQLTSPIEDADSAAALVPLILRAPAEFADKIKLIDLARELDDRHKDLREEALARLATGLDVPPEILQGKGGLSHWTSYNVDAEFIDKHIDPLGEEIAEFLTVAFLRPMLVEFEDMSEEDAAKYRLHFDSSKLTSKSDASGNARAAWDRKQISDIAYLRENGFDESDAPTEEEKRERDLRSLMESEPIIFGPQIIGMLYPDLDGALTIPGYDTAPNGFEPGDTPGNPANLPERKNPTDPSSRPIADQDTGQGEPKQRGPSGPRIEESILDRLATAGDAALERALERAGARMASKMNGTFPEMKEKAKNLSKIEMVSGFTQEDCQTLGLRSDDLFANAWDSFQDKAEGWLTDYFIEAGSSAFVAQEKARVVTDDLVKILDMMATDYIGRPIVRGQNGLLFPQNVIQGSFSQHEAVVE